MNEKIYTYGDDERLFYCKAILARRLNGTGRVHILPIPTTRDGKTVNGTELPLAEFAEGVVSGDTVLAYGAPDELSRIIEARGGRVVDAASDEGYLEKGAELTAIGMLARILNRQRRAPDGLRFGIIGYGRIGRRLTELLTFLGAEVTVFTSRPELWEDLGRLGVKAVGTYELPLIREGVGGFSNPFEELDILINTAPAGILTEEDAPSLAGVWVIELASGDNIPDAVAHEIMPSIPAKEFPESAAAAYAQVLLRSIIEF